MAHSVILFDIDGTLIRTQGAGRIGACRAMQSAFGVEPTSGHVSFAGKTDRGIVFELFELHGIRRNEANWNRFQEHYLRHLRETVKETEGTVLPGVNSLLQSLQADTGTVLGLLTGNTQKAAEIKLRHYALYDYFRLGGFGDREPCRDDVARIAYDAVVAELGAKIAARRILVVGDTPNDIRCAKAIGARVIAVTTGGFSEDELRSHDPDDVLIDLRNTSEFVAKIKES